MPTLSELVKLNDRGIYDKVLKKFGDCEIDVETAARVVFASDAIAYNLLTHGRGKKKPHSLRNYVRREGKMKNS